MKHHHSPLVLALWLITGGSFTAIHFAASGAPVFVFNSFGPSGSYNSGSSWVIGGSASPHGYQGHGEYFVPTVSGYLNQLRMGIRLDTGESVSHYFIAQDNGAGLPGTVLEDFPNQANFNGIVGINSRTAPLLLAGQKYWLCDEPQTTATYLGWCVNNLGITNSMAFETSPHGWFIGNAPINANCVFSITVVPIPEPASIGLVLLGTALTVGCRLRRR